VGKGCDDSRVAVGRLGQHVDGEVGGGAAGPAEFLDEGQSHGRAHATQEGGYLGAGGSAGSGQDAKHEGGVTAAEVHEGIGGAGGGGGQ